MKVQYRANGQMAEVSAAAGAHLVAAGICVSADEPKAPQKEKPARKPEKPTRVEPLTTDDVPVVPTKPVT